MAFVGCMKARFIKCSELVAFDMPTKFNYKAK